MPTRPDIRATIVMFQLWTFFLVWVRYEQAVATLYYGYSCDDDV